MVKLYKLQLHSAALLRLRTVKKKKNWIGTALTLSLRKRTGP